jgi:N-acetylglucosamine kinase-like BadF-type ATPase
VLRVAAGGDAVAGGIVDDAVAELAGAARAVLDGLGLSEEETDVVTAGGLWDDEVALVRERFTATLNTVAPRAVVIRPRAEPIIGAILLARGAA